MSEQSAMALGLQGCPICTKVGPVECTSCEICGARLHAGWSNSIQRTWAWLITSVVLYLPANFLPIMYTRFLGKETENTILGGVVSLWTHGSYPIAIIIFVASVFVPLGKILVLGWLCLSIQLGSTFAVTQKTKLYRVTEFVGRWSMIDVFVVGILVALIQLGNVMSILPGMAALAFAAMVVTTMLAAIVFDPRLLWMSAEWDDLK
ncbi:MAG: paraquat-inducible protein A [Gammaproteobacteria bacterium]|nr:paraquat-inducible protein A [Gammaproteobacteria bacterium]